MKFSIPVVGLTLFMVAGCNHEPTLVNSTIKSESLEVDHAAHGPHQGTLIELGKEEYHAELVHDETTVTIFILDGTAENSHPIDSDELTINLVHGGKAHQYSLTASPDDGDPEGKASRFIAVDSQLVRALEREDASAKLSVTIEGKPYRGAIAHDHSHHH